MLVDGVIYGANSAYTAICSATTSRLDLVVANSAEATDKGIAILRGNGDGSFQTATTLADDFPWSVAVRVDAPIDIVVANNAKPGMVEVLHGNGDGTFQLGVAHAVGSFPTCDRRRRGQLSLGPGRAARAASRAGSR